MIDENLPSALAAWLSERGHDVAHVRDWFGDGADDARIWRRALAEDRIVVTKDADFPLRRAAASTGPQVLAVQVGNRNNAALIADVEAVWDAASGALRHDQPVVVINRVS